MDKKMSTFATLAGAALFAGLVTLTPAQASDNPFAVQPLERGHMQLAETEGKCGEGKSAEGKCGEGKCGEGMAAEGKCGEGKMDETAEGKCGEGKCGGGN